MINKKVILVVTIIIVALLTGITIGYKVRSDRRNAQIYEKYNIVNTTNNNENDTYKTPQAAEIEEE